ncbi:MAG: redox-regulated ATPase YchF [Anaerolineales bacterium]|nr:redox-regulated ATPase YchF [Anaerolineales bacterium]
MKLAIIGLPNSTKTTVFNALTGSNRPVGVQVTGKLESFLAVVDVPDPRLSQLSALFKPQKTTHARVSYVDIAGLGKGVGQKGLGGPFRNQISAVDGFVHVVRAFEDDELPHPEGSIDPVRDINIIDSEFVLCDLLTVENRLQRLDKELLKASNKERPTVEKEIALFRRLQHALEEEILLRDLAYTPEELDAMSSYAFLTLKPVLVLINTGELDLDPNDVLSYPHASSATATIKGKLEMEIAQLGEEERSEFLQEYAISEPGLNRIIRITYELIGLQSFFTVGEDEVRAWTVRRGATAVEAAGVIHSDLAKGFIRAEVCNYRQVLDHGGYNQARSAGQVRLEGKDYVVQDGDILHVRFNV